VKAGRRFTKPMPPPKQEGVPILISDKVDFKLTLIKQDKEGHSILIKAETHQKEITNINLYAPNVSAPNVIKHYPEGAKNIYKLHHSGSGRL
jgi:hypothetical protein